MPHHEQLAEESSDWLAYRLPGLRFSIRAMLVTLTVATLIASHSFTGWQLHQAREEIRLLREGIDRRSAQAHQKKLADASR